MSTWPFFRVSFPRDHPVRYFAAGFSILSRWCKQEAGSKGKGRADLVGIAEGFQDRMSMRGDGV